MRCSAPPQRTLGLSSARAQPCPDLALPGRLPLSAASAGAVRRAAGARCAGRQSTRGSRQGSGTSKSLRPPLPFQEQEEGSGNGAAAPSTGGSSKGFYLNFTGFPFPLGPFLQRTTIRYEVERGRIWTFEQQQSLGLSSITTNIRMTVIKLSTGGLWVHSPIAPTTECIALLRELGLPVEHIVLPTFAYEHKVFVGPFSRRFPRARVWTAPLQWSWPLNLPPQLLGIFPAGVLRDPADSRGAVIPPWVDEIQYKVLSTPEVGIGPYVEVAFFHRETKTLLLTDAVILVPPSPPEVVSREDLLASAENGLAVQVLSAGQDLPQVEVEDTPQFRQLGWQRMVLLILYLGPANLLDPAPSFSQVVGKLIVSPVVKTLVYDKVPEQVLKWIDSICSDWSFNRIIPCHFSAPIKASPAELRGLFFGLLGDFAKSEETTVPVAQQTPGFFGFLKGVFPPATRPVEFPEDDLRTLRSLNDTLVTLGAVKKTGT